MASHLDDLFTQFLRERKYLLNLRPRTLEWYETAWKAFKKFATHSVTDVTSLTRSELEQFIYALRDRGVKPVTCNSRLQALNAFCRWLHENGHTPTRIKLRPLKLQKRLVQTPELDAIRALVAFKPAVAVTVNVLSTSAHPIRNSSSTPHNRDRSRPWRRSEHRFRLACTWPRNWCAHRDPSRRNIVTTRRPLIPLLTIALGVLSTADVEAQSASASALPALTTGRTHEGTTLSTPRLTAATSQCAQASDADYGTTPTSPIKVGGAPLYIADRSVKFMRTLRGPAGEPVRFKRLGSFDGPEDTTLDVWLVERVGLSQHFYLDGYRTSDVRAPLGWLCAADTPPARPVTSGADARRQFVEVAAATFGLADAPISIDVDGSAIHGVIFDHARLIGREAARARAGGQSIDAAHVVGTMTTPRFVVVAYPVDCPGREAMRAQTITLTDANGQSPRSLREARGSEIGTLVTGFDATGAALAVEYDGNLAIPGQIVITYDQACGATAARKVFPIRGQGGRITTRIAGQAPTGFGLPPGGTQAHVQVYFDVKGEPQRPVFTGGDGVVADAAVAAVRQFRATPPTINGAPVLQLSTVAVAFPR